MHGYDKRSSAAYKSTLGLYVTSNVWSRSNWSTNSIFKRQQRMSLVLSPQWLHGVLWGTTTDMSWPLSSNCLAFIPDISPGLSGVAVLITCETSNQVGAFAVYFLWIWQACKAAIDGINFYWTMITTQHQEPFTNAKWHIKGDPWKCQHQQDMFTVTFTATN